MYVNLNKEWLLKNIPVGESNAKEEFGEEAKDQILFSELEENEVCLEIDSERQELNVSFDSQLGYFSIDIPISDEDLITLIEIVTKKINRFKTALEALKEKAK